jgi:soluble lytic murein transglycosylase-like protein
MKSNHHEYDEIILRAIFKYKHPALTLAFVRSVIRQESQFDPNAGSEKGAKGLMQLMDATAKEYGCTDSFDPEQNIMAGVKYYRWLLRKYEGDKRLAMAGYNAGPGRVHEYGGVPPFKETRDYINKILGYEQEELA